MRYSIAIFLFIVGLNVLMFELSQNLLGQISKTYNQTIQIRFYLGANIQVQRSLALLASGLATGQPTFIAEAKKIFKTTSDGFKYSRFNRSQISPLINEFESIQFRLNKIEMGINQRELIQVIDKIEDVSFKLSLLENNIWKQQLKASDELLTRYKDLNLLINILAIFITSALGIMSFILLKKLNLEKEVAKNNQLRSSLYSSLAEAIFVTNSKGIITSCNQSSVKITGKDSRLVVGQPLEVFLGQPKIEKSHGILSPDKIKLNELIEKGKSLSGIRIHTRIRGVEKWFSVNLQPIFDQNNSNDFSTIISLTDVSEQVASQQKIKEQQENIIESSKSHLIAQMAGGIAHEITNPLTVISSSMELLDLKTKDKEVVETALVKKSTSKVIETISRLGKIVNGMLAMSRKDDSHFELTNIGSAITTATDFARILIDKHKVELRLKDDHFDEIIECNHIQISQVVINLIKNSVEAVKDLEERWIEIAVNKTTGGINITITDSGTGMSDDLKERVMLPFFTSKKIGEGTGLGLSISRTIIENHNGSIEISMHSKNTQFNIFLPFIINPDLKV